MSVNVNREVWLDESVQPASPSMASLSSMPSVWKMILVLSVVLSSNLTRNPTRSPTDSDISRATRLATVIAAILT